MMSLSMNLLRWLCVAAVMIGTTRAASKDDSQFTFPTVEQGKLSPVQWKKDGKQVDSHTHVVGLPPQLSQEIRDFAERSGLMDLFWKATYEDLVPAGDNTMVFTVNDGRKWAVTSPGQRWAKSSMHWIDVADEYSHEETLQVLKKGGFDEVLDAIGNHYKSDGLFITGMGFVVVSWCEGGHMHYDHPDSGDNWFDILIPIILPENDTAKLRVGDEDNHERTSTVTYEMNQGYIIGGDTWHGTADCDYRESRGIRVTASVYVVDLNEDNAEHIASVQDAAFPVPDNVDWFLAQQGRSWGNGKSLKNDQGRKPFFVKDERDDCSEIKAEGKCETDLWESRVECLKTCNIFIDNDRYYSEFIKADNSTATEPEQEL